MLTSVIGICNRNPRRPSAGGFSLLELLVVVAIIGVLLQAVTLSLGALGNDRAVAQETNRLRGVIDLLREEALMQSRDYGIMFTMTGYRFYVFDYRELKWMESQTDKLLQPHALQPQLELALALDGRDVPLERTFESQDIENAEPQVMLLASGELTPFTIAVSREGIEGRFELIAELDGKITINEEDFN